MTRSRRSWWNRVLGAALVAAFAGCEKRAAPPAATPVAVSPKPSVELIQAIEARLARADDLFDPTPQESKVLAVVYPAGSMTPLWTDERMHPRKSASDALAVLKDAAAEGLDPADYREDALATMGQALSIGAGDAGRMGASFDVTLSLSMVRYLRHYHHGRVNPRDIGFLLSLPPDEHDYGALVRDAALQGRVMETIASITPPLVQYRALRSMLPRYRALALIEGSAFPRLPNAPRKSIKAGDTAPALNIVRARLIALGDMSANAARLVDPPVYEGDLVDGVKHFQARHGFESDGILGRTTWESLNVPIRWRVRQIELAMERMRWLPHLGERPFVAVNVPMFRLWGWESVPKTGEPDFEMGVIVGKSLDTQTPAIFRNSSLTGILGRRQRSRQCVPQAGADANYQRRFDPGFGHVHGRHGVGHADRRHGQSTTIDVHWAGRLEALARQHCPPTPAPVARHRNPPHKTEQKRHRPKI